MNGRWSSIRQVQLLPCVVSTVVTALSSTDGYLEPEDAQRYLLLQMLAECVEKTKWIMGICTAPVPFDAVIQAQAQFAFALAVAGVRGQVEAHMSISEWSHDARRHIGTEYAKAAMASDEAWRLIVAALIGNQA